MALCLSEEGVPAEVDRAELSLLHVPDYLEVLHAHPPRLPPPLGLRGHPLDLVDGAHHDCGGTGGRGRHLQCLLVVL